MIFIKHNRMRMSGFGLGIIGHLTGTGLVWFAMIFIEHNRIRGEVWAAAGFYRISNRSKQSRIICQDLLVRTTTVFGQ